MKILITFQDGASQLAEALNPDMDFTDVAVYLTDNTWLATDSGVFRVESIRSIVTLEE